jgi:serine protease Do
MSERELIEKIDLYLREKLPEEERVSFESMIQKDAALAAKVREQLVLLEKIKFYGKRKALKETLNKFHSELDSNTINKSKRRFLGFTSNKTSLAIAASITGLLLVSISFYIGSLTAYQNEKSEYTALKRDVQEIEAAQNSIINDLKKSKAVVAPAHFSGTGFLISSQGYILTSYHLIKNADSIFVENNMTGRVKVEEIFQDKKYDIAVLKISEKNAKSLGKIPFMLKKKTIELGEKVFTLGFPREDIVYGEGSISSASGFKGDTMAYQISIPLNPGNSGGPLLDEQGNLIGMITGKHAGAEASNFAIKAEYIREFLNRDKENKIIIPQKNSIASMKRSDQIKKLKAFVFNIRVY